MRLSNTVSVLLGNGDGTFQAPRQYAVGSFIAGGPDSLAGLPNFGRAVVIADLTGNGIPDIIVANHDSGDISVLLGRGDGTFEPQRRFDATTGPFSIAVGDLTGNGIEDIVVQDSIPGPTGHIAVLLGRGDGTFQPEQLISEPGNDLDLPIAIADVNHDGIPDLIVGSTLVRGIQVLLGRGDGTFEPAAVIPGPYRRHDNRGRPERRQQPRHHRARPSGQRRELQPGKRRRHVWARDLRCSPERRR